MSSTWVSFHNPIESHHLNQTVLSSATLGGGDELSWGTGSDQVEGRLPAAWRAPTLASCLMCDEEPK